MEVDFGESWAEVAGVPCKVKYLVATLPYSNVYFAKAYPLERLESLLDGIASAFAAFRGAYPFRAEFCAPAKGWEKGSVERASSMSATWCSGRGWRWRAGRRQRRSGGTRAAAGRAWSWWPGGAVRPLSIEMVSK